MEISVVVPTFNRRRIVTRTVEALLAQDLTAAAYEVIVVVDGSTDGTAAAVRRLQATCPLRVIEQKNRGPSAARNTGYRAAAADLVLFLDDDMLADPGLVAAHLAAHKEGGRAIAFGSLFLSPDSPPGLPAESFNREIGAFYLERRRNPQREWRMADCVFSNASLPRKLLDEAGGFDETFRKREDLELGTRLLDAGALPRSSDKAVAYQYLEKTATDLIRDAEAFAVGDVMFARKHPHALVEGQLSWLSHQPRWKRHLLRIVAAVPLIADLCLAPVCIMGETCSRITILREMGVRALQRRRKIHWYHKVQELGWK